MIVIRREKIMNKIWFEIIYGPPEIKGVFIDAGLVMQLVSVGVAVKDWDAIKREMEVSN